MFFICIHKNNKILHFEVIYSRKLVNVYLSNKNDTLQLFIANTKGDEYYIVQ